MLLTKVHEVQRVLLDFKIKIELLACKRNDCVLEDTESNVRDAIFKPDFLHEANVIALLHNITGGK